MRVVCAAAVAACFAAPALPDTPPTMEQVRSKSTECGGIAGSVECDRDLYAMYDDHMEAVERGSQWDITVKESGMTEQETVTLSLDGDERVFCGYGRKKTVLVIRCRDGVTVAYIAVNCHLISKPADYGVVMYRLDSGDVKIQDFSQSTDNRALGLWRNEISIPFIKEMLGHETLTARFTPYRDRPVEARFEISGIENRIKPLRNACGW